MRVSLVIALNHLRRLVAKPGLILLLALIPLTLAGIQWAAFGRGSASGKLPPIRLLVLDRDESLASGLLLGAFDQERLSEAFRAERVASREQARKEFKRQRAAALVIVPEGFQAALLARETAELTLIRNPLQVFTPQAAASVMRMLATLGNGVLHLAREPMDRLEPLLEDGRQPTGQDVALIASGLYEAVAKLMERDPFASATLVVAREEGRESPVELMGDTQRFFGYVFPGLVLFTLLFVAESLARRLLRDRLQGLTRRLAMGPVSHDAVLAGGVIYLLVGLLAMLGLLALAGWLVFRIQLRDPLSLVLLGTGFAAFAAGLQLLVMGLMRTERSASAVAGIIIVLLALVGGTFLPLESYPRALEVVAQYTPNGAAHQGMVDVLVREQPRRQLVGRVALIWVWGAAVLGAGLAAERRRLVE